MSRLTIPAVTDVPNASKPLLEAVHKQLGVVPNLMKLLGNSPAALEGYLSLSGALAKGALDGKLRESLALTWPSTTAATTAWRRTATSARTS